MFHVWQAPLYLCDVLGSPEQFAHVRVPRNPGTPCPNPLCQVACWPLAGTGLEASPLSKSPVAGRGSEDGR
jgi:hypothetical protein